MRVLLPYIYFSPTTILPKFYLGALVNICLLGLFKNPPCYAMSKQEICEKYVQGILATVLLFVTLAEIVVLFR